MVINSVVVEILATPTVAPDGTEPSVEDPTYAPPMLISTSVYESPTGITKSVGNVISVVDPAAIPVGVVKTKEWFEAVPIFAEESVSDILLSAAADADPTLSIEIKKNAATLKKITRNFEILKQKLLCIYYI